MNRNKYWPTIKSWLTILVAFCVLLAAGLIIFSLMDLKPTPFDGINLSAGGPKSMAQITETGLTDEIPKATDMSPEQKEGAYIQDGKLIAFCVIADVDVATNITVTWTLPDGTSLPASTIAVNRDACYYSVQDITEAGDYSVTWQLYGKDPVQQTVTVLDGAAAGLPGEEII